jgi:arginine deiminase
VSFSVDSEVGRMRKVIVHRPGLEQRRFTPENAEELLFDDVIWVRKAKVEHAFFVQVLKERGVEVFDAEDLLLETLAIPAGKDWILEQVLQERRVGQYLALSGRESADAASPRDVSNFLIGGMTKDDLAGGAGLFYGASGPVDMMLPPLPNFLFQRDPSSWIYGGVTLNPMTKPARRPETAIMEAIYRFHPMFTANGGVNVWFGGVEQAWGRCTIEGGDAQTIGNGAVMIGMGERTSPESRARSSCTPTSGFR